MDGNVHHTVYDIETFLLIRLNNLFLFTITKAIKITIRVFDATYYPATKYKIKTLFVEEIN